MKVRYGCKIQRESYTLKAMPELLFYCTRKEKKCTVLEPLIFANSIFLWNFQPLILIITSIIEDMLPVNKLAGICNFKIKVYANQIKYIMVNLYL